MTPFIGNFQNKLDAKGRVSIPASFRSVLKRMSHAGPDAPVAAMYLRPSLEYPCIEVWTEIGFEKLAEPLSSGYDQFSKAHEDFAMALFGDARQAETDKEGRIVVPPELAEFANLKDNVTFIGVRNIFQIWEPEAGAQRLAEAKQATRANGYTLKAPETPQVTHQVTA